MATIPLDSGVVLKKEFFGWLRYPPPTAELTVVVHDAALLAPQNSLTLLAAISDAMVHWVGALDEKMMTATGGTGVRDGRWLVGDCLLRGTGLWSIIIPGDLIAGQFDEPTTVYRHSRPWIVVGALPDGKLLAVPVNDTRGQSKWYAPHLEADSVPSYGGKPSQAELAHLWSFPAASHTIGQLAWKARPIVEKAVAKYYGLAK